TARSAGGIVAGGGGCRGGAGGARDRYPLVRRRPGLVRAAAPRSASRLERRCPALSLRRYNGLHEAPVPRPRARPRGAGRRAVAQSEGGGLAQQGRRLQDGIGGAEDQGRGPHLIRSGGKDHHGSVRRRFRERGPHPEGDFRRGVRQPPLNTRAPDGPPTITVGEKSRKRPCSTTPTIALSARASSRRSAPAGSGASRST